MPEDSHHLADSKSEVEACLTKIVLIHEQFFLGGQGFLVRILEGALALLRHP